MCALELLRRNDVDKFGEWPFEIGLWSVVRRRQTGWVAKATMIQLVRARVREGSGQRYEFVANSARRVPLVRNEVLAELVSPDSESRQPTNLLIKCVRPQCSFARDSWLPIVAVDEPIYRRLPCFMIATVDKFAALPWTGEVGGFLDEWSAMIKEASTVV